MLPWGCWTPPCNCSILLWGCCEPSCGCCMLLCDCGMMPLGNACFVTDTTWRLEIPRSSVSTHWAATVCCCCCCGLCCCWACCDALCFGEILALAALRSVESAGSKVASHLVWGSPWGGWEASGSAAKLACSVAFAMLSLPARGSSFC